MNSTQDTFNLYDLIGEMINPLPLNASSVSFNYQREVYFTKDETSKVMSFEGFKLIDDEYEACIFLKDVIIISDGKNFGIINYYGREIIPMEYPHLYNVMLLDYILQNISW